MLFAIVWLGMLMKVSTSGIERVTYLDSGPLELVNRGLWPVAVAVAWSAGEAMAQTAAILAFRTMGSRPDDKSVYYFVGIDNARALTLRARVQAP